MKSKKNNVISGMPCFIYEGKIVRLVEIDKNVSVATDTNWDVFPVANKHLEIPKKCKFEGTDNSGFCMNMSLLGEDCESYFCKEYTKE